jgi:RNA polymerase sigma-70 factor, ECF subfamily
MLSCCADITLVMRRIYKDKTEAELALLLQQGEEEGFREIHTRFYPVLYSHAMDLLHDHDLAQDAIHDLLMDIWQRRKSIQIESNLKGYLYRGLRYSVIRQLDRATRYRHYLNSLEKEENRLENTTESQIIDKELHQNIETVIDLLPPKMREVFKLSISGDYSNRDLSAKLNIAEQTVKNHLYSANKILRPKISALLKNLSSFF